VAPFAEGKESMYFQDFAVSFDTSLLGQGFTAELGRTGYSVDPYIFQRPDVTPYFQNERWDNGKWMFDGGILGFHFGGAKLDVFAGRQSNRLDNNGNEIQPMVAGFTGHRFSPGDSRPVGLPGFAGVNSTTGQIYSTTSMPVDEHLGVNLNVPLSTNGSLNLAYIWLESNTGVTNTGPGPSYVADHADVFGGNLKWNFGPIVFDGGYSQSNLRRGDTNVVNRANYAWHAQAAYDTARWGAQVGYR